MNLEIKKRIDAINNSDAIRLFFGLLKTLITEAALSEEDPRLAINVRNDRRKRFSVSMNSRLVLSLKEDSSIGLMLNDADLDKISSVPVVSTENFSKLPQASFVEFEYDIFHEHVDTLRPLWMKSVQDYLPAQTSSQYRIRHIDELYRMAQSDELLATYLNTGSKAYSSFKEVVDAFRVYLKGEESVLSEFEYTKEDDHFVWICDARKIIGDLHCHYELELRDEKINVEVHFEGNTKRDFVSELQKLQLPERVRWVKRKFKRGSPDLSYYENYDFGTPDLLQKLAEGLLYLESNMGDVLRQIKIDMARINVKEEFIDWIIAKDGTAVNYYSGQFSSNRARMTREFDDYERIYRDDFQSELFLINPADIAEHLALLRHNIYSKSGSFSRYSKSNSNGRPMAILGKKNYLAFLKERFMGGKESKGDVDTPASALNQILFGPPGTGKTYHTINEAIAIVDPEFAKEARREYLKNEYDRLIKDGQIAFTTFHQSMSYEDFIEGIKPDTKESRVTYSVKDGIFKRIVKRALAEYIIQNDAVNEQSDFDILYDGFVESIKALEGKRASTFETISGIGLMLEEANNAAIVVRYLWNNSSTKEAEGLHKFSVSKEKLKKVLSEGIDPSKVKSLKTELHPLIGHIHCELFAVYKKFYEFVIASRGEIEAVHFNEEPTFKEVKDQFDLLSKEEIKAKTGDVKLYVLIIDEINRGNVSQIFGELITLIEEDKRLGKEEALEVTLPYSKEPFGVPSNLYIIGTMNTADRSVEALDTALRRRFSFREMPPKYNLEELEKKLFGYPLHEVLSTINVRIEKLLDRDHLIGHSYFLNKNEPELVESFYRCIIPLLQEYFFGDYGKIGLVLGGGFVRVKADPDGDVFTAFDYEGRDNYIGNKVYSIVDHRINDDGSPNENLASAFGEALKLLMEK